MSVIKFGKKEEDKKEVKPEEKEVKKEESFDFEAIMKANSEKASKMKNERNKSNKGVIRSYNLK